MKRKGNWNIANLLTMSRIVVAPIFLILIFRDELWCKWTAGVLFGLGAYSDYLDGYLARKYHLYSDLGALLDPLADNVLLLSAFLAFVQMQWRDTAWGKPLRPALRGCSRLRMRSTCSRGAAR